MGPRGAAAMIVACLLLAPPATAAAQAETADLEVDPSQQLTLNLGDQRGEPRLEVRFIATKSLSSAPSASIPPFQTAEGEALGGKVESKVKLAQEGRTVLATLTFSEIGDAEAGAYTSSLLLLGQESADARATITLKLDPQPVDCANFWAIVLLVVGAAVGLAARWVVTVAAKLKSLGDRLDVVEAKIHGFEPLPVVFRGKLTALRVQLARGDAGSSEATLKELEDQAASATQVAEEATSMRTSIAAQEKQVAAMQSLGENAGKLASVLAAERELIDAMLRSTEFESKAAAEARAGYLEDIRNVRLFLQSYANEESRAALETALGHFMRGEFKLGNEKTVEAMATVASAPAAGAPPATATPESVSTGGLRSWAVRNAVTIAAGFTALALVVVGLLTAYDPETTFRTEPFVDSVSLFAWGLGSAAAGIGLAEVTGKLTGDKG